jgi:phage tail sheath protein FI
MGAWINTIGTLGVHFIPATNATILNGIIGVVGDQFLDDNDRTAIAKAGVNLIQEKTGTGTKIANLFTVSTDTAYLFGNGILMRNFIKVSAQDSLSVSENTPNSFNRINADKMALLGFLYGLWYKGSTGTVPEGETFGQGQDTNGAVTVATDHFQVNSDISVNPQSKIDIGERTHQIYFTYPAPAGSIEIGVGILLRG